MNPGYLSYIAITLTAILVWSGWKSVVTGGFSGRGAYLFLLGWIAGSLLGWESFRGAGTFVYAPLLSLTAFVLSSSMQWNERFSIFSFALLLAAVNSLIELINHVDPFVLAIHPALHPVFVTAALAVTYSRNGKVQLALVSLALLIKDAYIALLYREFTPPVFGGRAFQDEWWMAAALTRSFALCWAFFSAYVFFTVRKWIWQLKLRRRS
ncbi:hypothetical protein [Paenibacillus alkalitolerans]|uniref:hypothetical protein n=1 Tax=Paenibacillus alkalitolerans TaxID=2799335 RepID=UPI0018F5CA27|nr:hypothetical protein [Paenibacillus alkalitolerans]